MLEGTYVSDVFFVVNYSFYSTSGYSFCLAVGDGGHLFLEGLCVFVVLFLLGFLIYQL